MKKCDYCGKECEEYDLERRMFARGRVKYICYKCRRLGDEELRKSKIKIFEKQGRIGDK
jgi:hypothetical protein